MSKPVKRKRNQEPEVKKSKKDEEEAICTVCLERVEYGGDNKIEEGREVAKLNNCNHVYHSQCIIKYVRILVAFRANA